MASLLAAMRPGDDFDPALALRRISPSSPSFSMRHKTSYGNWESHFSQTLGQTGLSGDLKNEMESSKSTAPVYSMRPRTVSPQPKSLPGPGTYEFLATLGPEGHPASKASPVWQFGQTDRDKVFNRINAHDPKTPPPGSYTANIMDSKIGRVDQQAVPSYSMRDKHQNRMTDPELRQRLSPRPGAGDYYVSHEHVDLAKVTAPKYSMRPKNEMAVRSESPAPDSYDIPEAVGNTMHPSIRNGPGFQFSITEREKAHGRINQHMCRTPSPSHYKVSQDGAIGRVDQEQVPSYSMRSKHLDARDAEYRQKISPTPGVHDYDVNKDSLDATRSKSPQYSMRSKCESPMRSHSPAPGNYESPDVIGNVHPTRGKSATWSFGSSNRDNAVGRIMQFMPGGNTPSPTKYDICQDGSFGRVDQQNVPSYSMRPRSKDRRYDPDLKAAKSPRPSGCDYNLTHDHVDLAKTKAPRFSMKSRCRSHSRSQSPGPGSYNVPSTVGRSKSPNPTKKCAGAWGFGSSKRFADSKPDDRTYAY